MRRAMHVAYASMRFADRTTGAVEPVVVDAEIAGEAGVARTRLSSSGQRSLDASLPFRD
jgi:hypothetical protein